MVQIGSQQENKKVFSTSQKKTQIVGPKASQVHEVYLKISKLLKNFELNIDNILDVLKFVFNILDNETFSLNFNDRKEAAKLIIDQIIDDENATIDTIKNNQSLKLLASRSLNLIASETLKPEKSDQVALSKLFISATTERKTLNNPNNEKEIEDWGEASKKHTVEISKCIHQVASELDKKIVQVHEDISEILNQLFRRVDHLKQKLVFEAIKGTEKLPQDMKKDFSKLIQTIAGRLTDTMETSNDHDEELKTIDDLTTQIDELERKMDKPQSECKENPKVGKVLTHNLVSEN